MAWRCALLLRIARSHDNQAMPALFSAGIASSASLLIRNIIFGQAVYTALACFSACARAGRRLPAH